VYMTAQTEKGDERSCSMLQVKADRQTAAKGDAQDEANRCLKGGWKYKFEEEDRL